MNERSVAALVLRTSPPAIPPRFVRRPRIEALLRQAVRRSVTLISAGPGYGKTLGLAHWVRQGELSGRSAWLSLVGSDDSLPGFWSALLQSVRASGVAAAGSGLLDLAPAASFGLEEAVGVIDGLAALPEPLTLVLDDLQHLRDRDLLRSIDLLLERRSPGMHVVLSTRFDPPLRLQRLAVADQLAEIRSRELAFTAAEARELLAGSGLMLTARTVDALVDRTRGWAAGLRLAAMGLHPQTTEADVARLRGSDRPVAEYLLEEVLDQLTADDRRFLLRSSVADPINAGLARELTGDEDAQARLERLEARNAFLVGLAGGRTWFGWHPLFRELLTHQLKVEAPATAIELHRRAASWLEGSGDYVAAIGHLTQIREWPAIGRLIAERAAPDLVAAHGGALADALEPAALRSRVDPTPATLLASALRNFRQFDYDAMLRDTNSAALAAGDGSLHPTDRATGAGIGAGAGDGTGTDSVGVDVLVAVLRMAYARARDPRSLVAASEEALRLLDGVPRHRMPAVERYRAVASANLGTGLLWHGDLSAAESTLTQARDACHHWELSLPELTARGHLAIIEAVHGRYRQAVELGEQAREVADRHGWSPEPQASAPLVALAWAALAAGRLDTADRLIAAAVGRGNPDAGCQAALAVLSIEVAVTRRDHPLAAKRVADLHTVIIRGKGLPPMLAACAQLAAADAQLALGNPAAARKMLPDEQPIAFADALRIVVLAKCLLAQDDAVGALDLLTRRLPDLDRFAAPAVDARLVASFAAARLRRDAQSLRFVADAVDIAVDHSIVRPFLLAGDAVRPLLGRQRSLVGRHPDFTAALLESTAAIPARAPAADPNPAVVLTERELSVLAYLPTYMKSNDIADDLFLSVNTVKSHLQSIYRKLGAASRQQAVRRARELGLL